MRIKRMSLLIFCLLLVTALLPQAALAEEEARPIITLSNETAKPGEDVTVAVDISENPGLMAMLFQISYDHSRLSLTGTTGVGLTGWDVIGDTILWLGNADSRFNGVILKLHFHVFETAAWGDTPVTLLCNDGGMGNHDEETILPEIAAGSVHIPNPCGIWITEIENDYLSYTVSAPVDASLIIAGYSPGGQMAFCMLTEPVSDTVLFPVSTEHIKLFLVDTKTFMPLCEAVRCNKTK